MKITKRRRSRELALQVLYAKNFLDEPLTEILKNIIVTLEIEPSILPFTKELLEVVSQNQEMFDQLIIKTATNWEIERIALVDKMIIRIALAEICFIDSIPYKVSIDEAIEIGKAFSTIDSGKFINGILDAIGKKLKKN